ncbi:MAG: DUF1801 domain-containing protein [Cytophagales bacterium]
MHSPAVDNYLFDKPEPVKLTLEVLREIIFEMVSDVEEQIKWGIPFYSKNGLLCYLNFEKKTQKVVLGLVEGNSITDKYNLFSHDTQQIKKIYFTSVDALPVNKVKYYLAQAVKINRTKEKNFINIRKKR